MKSINIIQNTHPKQICFMSFVKEPYDVMKTFFKKRIAQYFILIGPDFVVIEKLPDPEVLNSKTSGSGSFELE